MFPKETREKAIKYFGKEAQLNMVNEELAELQVALAHYRRGRIDAIEVAQEIVDAKNMIAQLEMMLGIDRATLSLIENGKLIKLNTRIRNYEDRLGNGNGDS